MTPTKDTTCKEFSLYGIIIFLRVDVDLKNISKNMFPVVGRNY